MMKQMHITKVVQLLSVNVLSLLAAALISQTSASCQSVINHQHDPVKLTGADYV